MTPKKSFKKAAGGRKKRGAGGGGRWRKKSKRTCHFCEHKLNYVDYKDMEILERNVSRDRGKILPKRKTANCAKHQRAVTAAIKRARIMALLPFAKE